MESGLTTIQAQEALQTVGANEIMYQQKKGPLRIFLDQFPSVINGVLLLAAIFSFVISDVFDGVFILLIILLNSLFGFLQQYQAEKALDSLKSLITPLSRVIREGKEEEIPTKQIVPRDVVIVIEGDRIPADGIVISDNHMDVDESVLTGESLPVAKFHKDVVYKGSLVVKGKAHINVEKTGMQTRFGQIADSLSTIEPDKPPLQKRLDSLGTTLSLLAIGVSLLIVPLGLSQGKPLFPFLLLAISVAIAAIPEGLPAVITIALAIGTKRMAKKRAIVRKMPAVETLGAVQVILSDKTGTLTQNSMRVKKHWLTHETMLSPMIKACILGNSATIIQKELGFDIVGDKTDGALLVWAQAQNISFTPPKKEEILEEYEFDPARKTISTAIKTAAGIEVFTRGAPEEVLKRCQITPEQQTHVTSLFESFAKEGLRVIGFAHKKEPHETTITRDHLEQHMQFLGFIGIYDPPREEAKKAVEEAHRAGIHTVMVTGDNEFTAMAIAKDVGLIQQNEDVITGEEMQKLTDEQLLSILGKARIFARTRPEDKLRLVELFKKQGYVVGVTGDGVNDALALKRADVGIAMGQSGTDVAKEASDIILLDDNFATLVGAIEEGRNIYNNIIKAIVYLLSGNLAQIVFIFLAVLFNSPIPLLPTQILWINLIADGLPALALASDSKSPHLLRKPPRSPHEPILNQPNIFRILGIGFILAVILFVVFQLLLTQHSETFARTVVFNLLVASRLILAFLVRGTSIFRPNKMLIYATLGTIAIQLIITFTPGLQDILHLGF